MINNKNLKTLLDNKKNLTMVGAHNPFMAKLIEKAGFEGVYLSGGGLSNSLGVSDTGILTVDDFVYFGKKISEAISVPLLADADTGFGDIETTVKKYIDAGISGLHLEDQVFPKRCGHLGGKEVVPKEEMIERIQKAVKVRDQMDANFLIMARTDARGASNIEEEKQFDEAVQRGLAYQESGADALFPESLRSAEEFQSYFEKVSAPLLANMTEFGKTPYTPANDFFDMGYQIVLFPVTLFRCLAGRADVALEKLSKDRFQKNLIDQMMTRNEVNEILNYDPNS